VKITGLLVTESWRPSSIYTEGQYASNSLSGSSVAYSEPAGVLSCEIAKDVNELRVAFLDNRIYPAIKAN